MRRFTKSLLALALTIVCVGGAKAQTGTLIKEVDFSKVGSYTMWHADGVVPTITENTLQYVNAEATENEHNVQYEAANGIKLVEGGNYKIRLFIKGSVGGNLLCVLGDWSNTKNDRVYFTTTEQTVDITLSDFPATINDAHVLIQSGKYVGTTNISKVQVFDMDETPYPELQEFDISLDAGDWTEGWAAGAENTDGKLKITLTGAYGGKGYHFSAADLTNYAVCDKICVVVDTYAGGWAQLIFRNGSADVFVTSFGGAGTKVLQFNNTTPITDFYIQGSSTENPITVSRVYMVEKVNYLTEGKTVSFNGDGFIPRANLAYYADDAKLDITLTAAGTTLNNYIGWGIGKFESAGTSVQLSNFSLINEGDNVYSYVVGDFKAAFNADKNGAGDYGINWVVWGQDKDHNTFTRKSIKVSPVIESVSIGESGFATHSFNRPVNVNEVVTAYGAKYDGSKIVLTPVTEVPAGVGVILEAPNNTYAVPTIRRANTMKENELLVSDGSISSDGTHHFALGKKGGVVGFVKVKNGVTIPTGKAYLYIDTPPTSRDFIGFADEDVTGVNEVKGQKKEGRSEYFNLAGQRVAQPTKGLYIVNGKKVILK
jgi:hypothetical protein